MEWPDPHLVLTLTKQKKNRQEGGKKTTQCNGCCLKQEKKKQKCSEATSPLPMSHAALSPLVERARGTGPSPGQSVKSMQMVSGELCLMAGIG